jgi:hypothetical protein
MGVRERQREVRGFRGQMWSPGRPSTARREDRVRFWEAIAHGAPSEDAAVVAGVSQAVGSRWFRQGGGMPPISLAPVSGRYLSFHEREEIAMLHAQPVGVREIASLDPLPARRDLRLYPTPCLRRVHETTIPMRDSRTRYGHRQGVCHEACRR